MSLVVSKLKVAQLKSELAARNLSTAGLKAVLADRLQEALDNEVNPQALPLPPTAPPEPSTATVSSSKVSPDPSPFSTPAKRPRSSPSAASDRQPRKTAKKSPARRSARPSQNQSPALAVAPKSPLDHASDPSATLIDPPAVLSGTEHGSTSAAALDATTQSIQRPDRVPQPDQPPAIEIPSSPPALPQEPQPSQINAIELSQSADQPALDPPAIPAPQAVFQEPQPIQIDEAVPQEPQPIQIDEPAPQPTQADQPAPQESRSSQFDSQQSRQSPVQPSPAPVTNDPSLDIPPTDLVPKVEPQRPDVKDACGSSGEAQREPPPESPAGLVHAPAERTSEDHPKPPLSSAEVSSTNGPSSKDAPTLDASTGPKLARQDKPDLLVKSPDKAATPVVDTQDPALSITDEPADLASSTNIQADRPEQRLATVSSSQSTFSKRVADEPSTSDDTDSDRPPVTRSVYISNLVRPLTVPQIKKKLSEFGEMETFWIDAIRTHAYATFARQADAVEAYEALHQTTPWPPETGKVLSLLYVPADQVSRLIAEEEENAHARVQRGRLALWCGRATEGWQFELRPISSCGPARPRGLASSIPSSMPASVGMNDRHAGHKDDPPHAAPSSIENRIEHKLVFVRPDDNPKGGPEKWFKKTQARPNLFWAPAVPL